MGVSGGQAEQIAQEFLGLPCLVDLLAVSTHPGQLGLEEIELGGGEVFLVAAQEGRPARR